MGRFDSYNNAAPAGVYADGLPEGTHTVRIVNFKESKDPRYPSSLKLRGNCTVVESDSETLKEGDESQFSVSLGQQDTIVGPLLASLAAALLGVDSNDPKAVKENVTGQIGKTIEAALEEQLFTDTVIKVHAKQKISKSSGNPYMVYTFSAVSAK